MEYKDIATNAAAIPEAATPSQPYAAQPASLLPENVPTPVMAEQNKRFWEHQGGPNGAPAY